LDKVTWQSCCYTYIDSETKGGSRERTKKKQERVREGTSHLEGGDPKGFHPGILLFSRCGMTVATTAATTTHASKHVRMTGLPFGNKRRSAY
jgi:uncharacterized protein (DUF2345 family)